MPEKAEVINLKKTGDEQSKKRQMRLDSGRHVRVHMEEKEEILEIVEPEGKVVLKVRLTDTGPIITVQGARLDLKSTESLTFEAKKIKIKAEEQVVVESKGSLKIDSSEKMNIHSDQDIRVVGKMIHLN